MDGPHCRSSLEAIEKEVVIESIALRKLIGFAGVRDRSFCGAGVHHNDEARGLRLLGRNQGYSQFAAVAQLEALAVLGNLSTCGTDRVERTERGKSGRGWKNELGDCLEEVEPKTIFRRINNAFCGALAVVLVMRLVLISLLSRFHRLGGCGAGLLSVNALDAWKGSSSTAAIKSPSQQHVAVWWCPCSISR